MAFPTAKTIRESYREFWHIVERHCGVLATLNFDTKLVYKMPIRLYCMNGGHHLRILEDGTTEGSRDENDQYSKVAMCLTAYFGRRLGDFAEFVLNCDTSLNTAC